VTTVEEVGDTVQSYCMELASTIVNCNVIG